MIEVLDEYLIGTYQMIYGLWFTSYPEQYRVSSPFRIRVFPASTIAACIDAVINPVGLNTQRYTITQPAV